MTETNQVWTVLHRNNIFDPAVVSYVMAYTYDQAEEEFELTSDDMILGVYPGKLDLSDAVENYYYDNFE